MIKKQGQPPGPRRGNLQRFPYEPRVVGGKLLMPEKAPPVRARLSFSSATGLAPRG
jgi:hypothetical protein